MNLAKYWKAIASAIGTVIATGVVVGTGTEPENITTVAVALTGALNTVLVLFFPANKV